MQSVSAPRGALPCRSIPVPAATSMRRWWNVRCKSSIRRAAALLLIENVGNLVCPALFDLGEAAKIVILSVTEGQDKPMKYPHMFRAAQLLLVNKTDLLPHVDFDVETCFDYARRVNPEIELLRVSARTGEGLDHWYGWLRARMAAAALRAVS
jgi:hydrogenase nickel incorporation protein HypB